jgi:hypothetical protein
MPWTTMRKVNLTMSILVLSLACELALENNVPLIRALIEGVDTSPRDSWMQIGL